NSQLFEGSNSQDAVEEAGHAVIGAESKAGDGIAGKIFEADNGSNLFEFFGGNPTTVSSSDYRPNAGSGNEVRHDASLLQRLQDPNMRETAGKTTAQRQSNPTRLRRLCTKGQFKGFRLTSKSPQRFPNSVE